MICDQCGKTVTKDNLSFWSDEDEIICAPCDKKLCGPSCKEISDAEKRFGA